MGSKSTKHVIKAEVDKRVLSNIGHDFPVSEKEIKRICSQIVSEDIITRILKLENGFLCAEIEIGSKNVGLAVSDNVKYLEQYQILQKRKDIACDRILIVLREKTTDKMIAFEWEIEH